jgi:hypothetical protein
VRSSGTWWSQKLNKVSLEDSDLQMASTNGIQSLFGGGGQKGSVGGGGSRSLVSLYSTSRLNL